MVQNRLKNISIKNVHFPGLTEQEIHDGTPIDDAIQKVKHLLEASQIVRRAKQFADLELRIRFIDPKKLVPMLHSDAAFANASNERTQGGQIAAFTSKDLISGAQVPWVPTLLTSSAQLAFDSMYSK